MKKPQRGPRAADEFFAQRNNHCAVVAVGLGIRGREPRRDDVEFRLRVSPRTIAFETTDDPEKMRVTAQPGVRRFERDWRPQLRGFSWELEPCGHDAHDDVSLLVEYDRASDDVGIAAETTLPQRMTENDESGVARRAF